MAIKLNDKLVQIDLVDVSKNQDSTNFLQKSSFIDLSSNIKGVFSITLLRAVISNMEISPQDALESILAFARNNENSLFAKNLEQKMSKGYKPSKVRFSLGNIGLKLVVDLVSETGKIKIDFDLNPRVDYKNLDILAKHLLQDQTATASDIFHSTKLAKFIKERKPEKVQKIWNDFIEIAEKRVKKRLN